MFKHSNILKYVAIFVFLTNINLAADMLQGIKLYEDLEYAKAKTIFSERENLKNPLSHFYLAQMYANAKGTQKDMKKAFKHYLSAAELGDIESKYQVAKMYRSGDGVDKNIKESDFWYLEVFKSMDEKWIEKVLMSIQFPKKNDEALIKQIIVFLEDKAKNKNILSKKILAHMYYKNIFNVINQEYAMKLMKEIVEKDDDVVILTRLSRYYLYKYEYEGKNNTDAIEAFEYSKRAALKGSSYSQNRLAQIYEFGFGVDKDMKKALYWYTKAANKDNNDAIDRLKLFYKKSKLSQEESAEYKEATSAFKNQDYQKAMKFYMLDANSDSPSSYRSQFNLGVLYTDGLGVSKNLEDAFKWYLMSANQGFARAQNEIGDLYLYGKGVDSNIDTAVFWYRKASLSGYRDVNKYIDKYSNNYTTTADDSSSKNTLKDTRKSIYDYLTKQKVNTKNIDDTLKWLSDESQKNNVEALYILAILYHYGEGIEHRYDKSVPVDNAKALFYYEKAADKGHLESILTLARAYKNGWELGLKKDASISFKFYEKAAKLNNTYGLYELANMYKYGIGTSKDIAKAKRIYEKLYKQNEQKATLELAKLYEYDKSFKKAIAIYKEAFEKFKSKSALYNLSGIYSSNYDFIDKQNELWCYEMLYSLGDKRYAYKIAELYRVEFKNDKKMQYWYQKAIDANDLFATYKYDTICMINPQFNCLDSKLMD